ncbi:MAG TPA: tetratricopeptide repeat protein [Casimicrobiaceae bacterium]|nr:tetratricopeptide repeat protein [Casimicrobiaceae bacterium]
MSEGYSLRDVGKLLGLSRSIIGRLIEAGFVTPARGRRHEYRFSFQDLVVLRAAQGLTAAKIPAARILRSLKRLRAQLPEQIPLAGLRIEAVGDSVVVNEGDRQWQPEDGQYVFRFEVAAPDGGLAFVNSVEPASAPARSQWFEQGQALEAVDAEKALEAYRRAIADDARDLRAYVNLGRLLHERGRMNDAEAVYRDAIAKCEADGTLLFNLGVLLEDRGRAKEAANAYRAALNAEPTLADAHFNLARLCEAQGLRREALRHWSALRKLTGKK